MAASAHFDSETGDWLTADGTRIPFLPELPAQSPPHELISTGEPDEASPDGHTHYAIGSDEATVDAIVAYYEAKGTPVPAGYKEHGARHAERVAAIAAGKADPAARKATPRSSQKTRPGR